MGLGKIDAYVNVKYVEYSVKVCGQAVESALDEVGYYRGHVPLGLRPCLT